MPGSASSSRIDPASRTSRTWRPCSTSSRATRAPGAVRDTLLRHWYRGKILKRLDGKLIVRYPDDYRSRFLDVVIPIARTRFGPGVQDGLPFPLRIRSALLGPDYETNSSASPSSIPARMSCRRDIRPVVLEGKTGSDDHGPRHTRRKGCTELRSCTRGFCRRRRGGGRGVIGRLATPRESGAG